MHQTFGEFIIARFTLRIFISVIVYKIFNMVLDELLVPFFYMFVDPHDNLSIKKIKEDNHISDYGKSLVDFLVLLIILYLTYLLFI